MTTTEYVCPSALNIKGEHFPCQQMEHMAPGSTSHDGWAHSNRDAEAIWTNDSGPWEYGVVRLDGSAAAE